MHHGPLPLGKKLLRPDDEIVRHTPLPARPGPPSVVETHTAMVFLVGSRAYKAKKPVRYAFVDFHAPQERHAACQKEFALNQRLAPDVYREVLEIREPDGSLRDAVLVMERLPAEMQLSHMVESGSDVSREITAIAHRMASFHASVESEPQIGFDGTAAPFADFRAERTERSGIVDLPDGTRMADLWNENLSQLRTVAASGIEDCMGEIESLGSQYLRGRAPLLTRRVRDGRIRDGHGDLRCESVYCLDDGPRIIDCLEFDDRLRLLDGLCDISFLAADLDYRNRTAESALLLSAYHEMSGDHFPSSLALFYKAYWATVRAKVAWITTSQGAPQTENPLRWLVLARDYLAASTVRLVLIGGRPGTGKSMLAAGLGDDRGWTVLRSDEVRRQIAPGDYSAFATDFTYHTMLKEARELLVMGEPVILDATWSSEHYRRLARDLAEAASASVCEFECDADDRTVRARIGERTTRGDDFSEATVEVSKMIAERFDPWPEAHRVDTDQESGSLVEAVANLCRIHNGTPHLTSLLPYIQARSGEGALR